MQTVKYLTATTVLLYRNHEKVLTNVGSLCCSRRPGCEPGSASKAGCDGHDGCAW